MTSTASTVIFALAAALLALATILSVRSGRILWYPAQIQADRVGQHALFWALVAAQLVGTAALGWLAYYY